MKTLIELYDERPLENILATEVFRPETTVFLAPEAICADETLKQNLRAFLAGRGIQGKLVAIPADMNSPAAVAEALAGVYQRYPDCALEIAGGTDAALFAAGLFAAGGDIPVFTYSRRKNRFFNIRNAPFAEVDARFVRFSVADFLGMAGGAKRAGRVDNAALSQYMWLIEPFFACFLQGKKTWVHTINWMQAASEGKKGAGSLDVCAPHSLKAVRARVSPDEATLTRLAALGMLKDLSIEEDEISFSFADAQIRFWLRDIGSVLELYVYKACQDSGLFNDVCTSVIVDWSGAKQQDGVSNEIDVMASRGLTPLFISCKTGEIKTEALNELAILRDRFGGGMARALIVTAETAEAGARNRAAQLGIAVADQGDLAEGRLIARLREIADAAEGV